VSNTVQSVSDLAVFSVS